VFSSLGFEDALRARPEDTLSAFSLALSCLRAFRGHVPLSMLRKIVVRVRDVMPLTPMKDLKSNHVSNFCSIRGNVVRVGAVRPLVSRIDFVCSKCGSIIRVHLTDGHYETPSRCVETSCKSRKFHVSRASSVTRDWQQLKLQEIEDDVSEPGRVPRTISVELSEDLVDSCIPGDVVVISGIVKKLRSDERKRRGGRSNNRAGLYVLYIDANDVSNTRYTSSNKESVSFTNLDLEMVRKVYHSPSPFELIVSSICPTIFGHELIKFGLALILFGGDGTDSTDESVSVRGDMHCLMVGDPGLGKSQLLKAVSSIAPRSVYVCGNTATASGLTVTIVKDGSTSSGLEAGTYSSLSLLITIYTHTHSHTPTTGALVLSDQGLCCIDEFDKMGQSHNALLEVMEQQRVSVAKAGIVCNLSARCSIVAAANPVGGHYDRGKTVAENLKMSAPLLSRFDLIFILLDRPDARHDERLASYIMSMHTSSKSSLSSSQQQNQQQNHNDDDDDDTDEITSKSIERRLKRAASSKHIGADPLPPRLLRRYVAYARRYVHPVLTPEAATALQKFYISLRSNSEINADDAAPVTTRQLESLIRLSQARAKIELRTEVTKRDALEVIALMKETLVDMCTDEFGVVDFRRNSGMSRSKKIKTFVQALQKCTIRKHSADFSTRELTEIARSMRLEILDVPGFLDMLNDQNYLLKRGPGRWRFACSSMSQQSSASTSFMSRGW